MAMVYPYEGRKLAAERIVGKKHNGYSATNSGRLCLRLFKNDYTPAVGSAYANFTEADFTSYAAINLAAATWNAAALNVSNNAFASYPPQIFVPTDGTGNTIYGYYVTTDPSLGSDLVLCAERFATPRTVAGAGDDIGVGLMLISGDIGVGATIPYEGRTLILDKLTGHIASQVALALRLFRNNPSLAGTTVLSDLTTANYSGYADGSLAYTGWQVAVQNSAGRGQVSQSAATTFTHNQGATSNTIYGYAVIESGKILWAQNFDEAAAISGDNPYYYVQGRFEVGVP